MRERRGLREGGSERGEYAVIPLICVCVCVCVCVLCVCCVCVCVCVCNINAINAQLSQLPKGKNMGITEDRTKYSQTRSYFDNIAAP